MFFLKVLPDEAMITRFTGSPERSAKVHQSLRRMREASLLIRQVERYFSGYGLSQLKFLIMIVIERENDRDSLRASEISARLDVSKPVLHRSIQALIEQGLIVGMADPQDKRAELLSLTKAGRDVLNAALPGYFDVMTAYQWEDL